jgi:flavin reductase (DIM6/NTAB) family NADH-FMN oxidoreductase RutF
MAETHLAYAECFPQVMRALTSRGLLVGAYAPDGKPNLMTIGWAMLGAVWGRPMWTVLVRPSRYTYRCIEAHAAFTVSVPAADMAEACRVCGSVSGRDADKFDLCGLTVRPGGAVDAPGAAECPLVYECKVVHTGDVLEQRLAREIVDSAYAGGDFHRVYFGEIVAVHAAADAAARLRG